MKVAKWERILPGERDALDGGLPVYFARIAAQPVDWTPMTQHFNGHQGGFWQILEGGERMMTLLLVISGCFLLVLLGGLVVPLVLAAILAAVTWPLREFLVTRLKGRVVLACLLLDLGLLAGVMVPLGLVLALAVFQVRDLVQSVRLDAVQGWMLGLLQSLERQPWGHRLGLEPEVVMNRLAEVAPKVASWVLSHAADVSLGLATSLVMAAIMLLCLFYLHLSGDRLVARVRMALPLPEGETEALLEVFRRTSLAILKGNFVVALVQGALTGVLFMTVGLPSPVLFGVVAGLCSLVPSIGSALVWVPGAIALAAMGSWGSAIAVVLVGALVISMVDNVLRPVLVGRDTGMHDLLVLLTTLGGISFFGPLGILFGPLVGAAFLALLERHEKRLLEARKAPVAHGAEAS